MIPSRALGGQAALVVFVDHTECAWLQPLKHGFRHCFVALDHDYGWLVCDSLKGHMELTLLDLPKTFDLGRCYAEQGHQVLAGRTRPPVLDRPLTLAPLTCVSVAKRLLALRAARVWTPWQLFRHLLDMEPRMWRTVSAGKPGCRTTEQLPLDKSR